MAHKQDESPKVTQFILLTGSYGKSVLLTGRCHISQRETRLRYCGILCKSPARIGANESEPLMATNGTYVVLQIVLKEKFLGTGSGNLTELESAINAQAALGYRLHTITTSASGSKGLGGGDRIQATMVFERLA